jgi:hypothetical protein
MLSVGVTRYPGPCWVGEGGVSSKQVMKSYLSMSTVMRKRWRCGLLSGLVHFRLVAPPLQPGVVGPYPVWLYVVYGFPAVCHWREPVISRILDRNRWPVVRGVLDPDNTYYSCYARKRLLSK